jgi:hypothetical protein
MLVLIAGVKDDHRRQFQKAWYKEPEGYEWRWGRSPFRAGRFVWPREVHQFCMQYNYAVGDDISRSWLWLILGAR